MSPVSFALSSQSFDIEPLWNASCQIYVTNVTVGSLWVSKPFPQFLVAIPIIVKGGRWRLRG